MWVDALQAAQVPFIHTNKERTEQADLEEQQARANLTHVCICCASTTSLKA